MRSKYEDETAEIRKPADYLKAGKFFNELSEIISSTPIDNERLQEIIEKNKSELPFVFTILYQAMSNLARYECQEIEYLASQGFNIHDSVAHVNPVSYLDDAHALCPVIQEPEISKEQIRCMLQRRDALHMFARYLTAYADIAEYEAQIPAKKKLAALEKVLERRR